MSKDTGGTAFPGYDIYGDGKQHLAGHPHGGMSLRDYFAAQALGGCEVTCRDDMSLSYFEPAEDIAKRCFAIADAMLKERAK